MSTALFNIALEGVINGAEIDKTIFSSSLQTIGYADDLALVTRDIKALETVLSKLEEEAERRGLRIKREDKIYDSSKRGDTHNKRS